MLACCASCPSSCFTRPWVVLHKGMLADECRLVTLCIATLVIREYRSRAFPVYHYRWHSRSPSVTHHRLPCVCVRRSPALGRCAAPWSPPRAPERHHGAARRHGAAGPQQLPHHALIILGPPLRALLPQNTPPSPPGPRPPP